MSNPLEIIASEIENEILKNGTFCEYRQIITEVLEKYFRQISCDNYIDEELFLIQDSKLTDKYRVETSLSIIKNGLVEQDLFIRESFGLDPYRYRYHDVFSVIVLDPNKLIPSLF